MNQAIGSSAKREVDIRDQDPLTIVPHGDRLLVEIVAVDDSIPMPDGKKLYLERDEYGRGWCAGVVINVGGGHRLDVPDQAVVMKTNSKNVTSFMPIVDPDTGEGVIMAPSTVGMPFERGMTIMCAKFAGSDIKLQGKEYKIISQAHVIAVFTGVKMQVGGPQETIKATMVNGTPESAS